MAQTNPSPRDTDDKPRPMLYDGWGFVPIADLAETAATEVEVPDQAAA